MPTSRLASRITSRPHARSVAPLAALLLPLLASATLVGAPLSSAVHAQRSDARTAHDDVAGATSARDARWVLQLADGRALRARARRLDPTGPWELHQGDAWIALPAQAVRGAHEEASLLAEFRAREQELRGGTRTAEERARGERELVDFALERGLQKEGLARLDALLAKPIAGDERALQALIDRHAPRVRMLADSSRAESWGQVAKLPPAGREFALRQLGREQPAEQLATQLQHELGAVDPARRACAALALRRLQPGRATEGLLARALYDGAEPVRLEAARALRDGAAQSALKPLLGGLASNSVAVRANAAEALGVLGMPAAVPALVAHATAAPSSSGAAPRANVFVGTQRAYVQDYDVEVATGESIADPSIGVLSEGSVLDVRVLGVSTQTRLREQRAVESALARLTGARAAGAKAWARWWENEGQTWYAQHAPQTGPDAAR